MKKFLSIILLLSINISIFASANEDLIRNIVIDDLGGVKRAIKKEADVNIRIRDLTPLMIASGRGNIDVVNALLEANADPNVVGDNGKTALTIALRRNQLKVAEALIQKGADINAKDDKGVTPLMWAVYEGRSETVKFIIDNKGDVNIANNIDKSALRYAKEKNNKEIIKMLEEAGAE
ncbi:MAG: ankyrin repeat domain-containing protein [Leptospiraceae bacterium]|nr:ankyrin repeat domain-containing protein [Leptospiraceae bacterium]